MPNLFVLLIHINILHTLLNYSGVIMMHGEKFPMTERD